MNKLIKLLSKETKSNVGSDILMMVSLLGAAVLAYIGKHKMDELLVENRELRERIKIKDQVFDIMKHDLDKSIEKVKTEIENNNQ